MKLAIYHNVIAPYKTPFFRNICNEWPGEVLLYTSSNKRNSRQQWGEQSIRAENLSIKRLPGVRAPGIGWYNPTVFPRLMSSDFDVLMTGDYHFLSSILATYAAILRGKPRVLYTVATHRSVVCNPEKSMFHKYLNAALQYVTGRAPVIYDTLRRYDAYVTPSETSIAHLTSNGVERDRIEKIYNPVDTAKFSPDTQNDQQSEQLVGDADFVLTFIGRLVREKGLNYLIDSLSLCKKDVHVLVAGNGPEESNLREQAITCEVDEQVHFLGRVEHSRVPNLHAVADAFVLPSVPIDSNVEQFPNALLEGIASGLPAVTFDIEGGIEEIHDDGITGVKAGEITGESLAAAIRRLYKTDYRVLGKNARERIVDEFSPDVIGRRYVDLLSRTAES